jgi:hypothetical protein
MDLEQTGVNEEVISTAADETICVTNKESKTLGAVWKYTLDRAEVQEIGLPSGAQILSVCAQKGKIVLYAMGDKDNLDTDTYRFYVYGTSVEFDMEEVTMEMFLGSVVIGDAVVHVFVEQVETLPIDDPDLQ